MNRLLLSVALTLLATVFTHAQSKVKVDGFAERGGLNVKVSPTVSYKVQQSFPSATITVYLAGTTTLASIYTNSSGTIKANPFTAGTDGRYEFYADAGTYDVKFSGTGITTPFTIADISVARSSLSGVHSPLDYGAVCDGVVDDTAEFNNMITDIGSAETTVNLNEGICKLNNITLPANITWIFTNGAGLMPATGQTVTILGNTPSVSFSKRYYNALASQGTISFIGNTFVDKLHPQHWGAKGDGSNDDTSAIQATIDVAEAKGGGVVYFINGIYKITGITVAANNVELLGSGAWSTQLAMNSATGDTVKFDNGNTGMTALEDNTYLRGCKIQNIKLEPLVTRTSGSEIAAYRFNKLYLNDLVIHNAYQGMLLGRAGDLGITAYVNNLRMRTYKMFGIKMVNIIELWGNGWSMDKYDQTDGTYSIWLSGLTSTVNLVNADVVNSKVSDTGETANFVVALYIHDDTGLSGALLLANNFTNSYFDSHTRGVFADAGTNNYFANCFFADRSLGTGGTPGVGVTIAGGTDWSFVNCYAMNNGGPGYYLGGNGSITIMGGAATGNNQQGYPNTSPYSAGIIVENTNNVRIIGTVHNKNTSIFPSNLQHWGIWIAAIAGDFDISHNYLKGNQTGPINNLAGLTISKRIVHNEGYYTENSGNSAILSGTTSIVVSHGLSATPAAAQILIRPTAFTTNDVQCGAVTAVTSTTFTVACKTDPGVSGFSFGWKIAIF